MHLQALKPWYNPDHEGQVEPGQVFEASEHRGKELIRLGLAMASAGEIRKIKIAADPPARRKK